MDSVLQERASSCKNEEEADIIRGYDKEKMPTCSSKTQKERDADDSIHDRPCSRHTVASRGQRDQMQEWGPKYKYFKNL